jgi:hypothetical protein
MNKSVKTAITNITENYYSTEKAHFLDGLEPEEYKSKSAFIERLKEHMLYSIIVLQTSGKKKETESAILELWETFGEEE